MIQAISIRRRCWRIISPRWAQTPLSGEGAAKYGGRWNRIGTPALYLAEDIETAFAEYQQMSGGFRPGLFAAFDVVADAIADLTITGERQRLGLSSDALTAPWRDMVDGGETPPGWQAHDQLAAGFQGVRVPSVQRAGYKNIVLWRWNEPAGASVEVLDPQGDLPTRP